MGRQSMVRDFERRTSQVLRSAKKNRGLEFLLEHPVRTLLVGVGIGLFVSAAMMRR